MLRVLTMLLALVLATPMVASAQKPMTDSEWLQIGLRRIRGTKKYIRPQPIGVTYRPTRSWMKSPVTAAPAAPGSIHSGMMLPIR